MKRLGILLAAVLVICLFTLPFMGCAANTKNHPPGAEPSQQPVTAPSKQGQEQTNTRSGSQTTKSTDRIATGLVEVHLTDAPPSKAKQLTSIMLTISSVEIHSVVAGRERERTQQGNSDNATISDSTRQVIVQERERQRQQQGGDSWIRINIIKNNTIDLLKIKGMDTLIATKEVQAGEYTQVRLSIDKAVVGYSNNTTETAIIPSNEIKFVKTFNVLENKTTALIIDFDADKSVHFTGSEKVMIKPVVKLEAKSK